MKRSTLIIAALCAFALHGCNMGGSSSTASFPARTEMTETVTTPEGTNTFVTKFKYDQWGIVTEEATTKNGVAWRHMKDYASDTNSDGAPTRWCYRTTTNDDGSTVTHKLLATFGAYFNGPLETRFEVIPENSTQPIEWRTVEYEEDQIKRYETWTADGETVLRTNFQYTTSPRPIQTFTETRNGEPAVRVGVVTTQYDGDLRPLEYKMYRNIPETNWDGTAGETAQLVEERVDYTSESGKTGWTNKKYEWIDGVSNLVSTTVVSNKLENITITIF